MLVFYEGDENKDAQNVCVCVCRWVWVWVCVWVGGWLVLNGMMIVKYFKLDIFY